MLKYIGFMIIVYLTLMGLARLFGGKQPKREVCITREYESNADNEVQQQPEQRPEQQERR